MDPRFSPHNLHRVSRDRFVEFDPHLSRLRDQPLIYESPLVSGLPRNKPGIYTLGGGRQVGKTTLVKQWMATLLEEGVEPDRIVYLTGELIDDHHALVRLFDDWQASTSGDSFGYFLVDEVTYVSGWDKGVKFLADAGLLDNTAILLTGSDLALMQELRMRLPGRRGREDVVDFHIAPLSFGETVSLKGVLSQAEVRQLLEPTEPDGESMKALFRAFDEYLVHGGYLTALNDHARIGRILPSTLATYSDWIRGDVLKRNKNEHYLREILGAVLKCYGSQVTWNGLSRDLSIDHPATVGDYIGLLERMDVLHVRHALREDRLAAAPRKARKVDFRDPFIFHAVSNWLMGAPQPADSIAQVVSNPERCSSLVEAVAVTHLARYHQTFYIKGAGEVDAAFVIEGGFQPVEVKWTRQRRPKELRQLSKYPNSVVWDRSPLPGVIQGIPSIPLPLALLRLTWQAG